ESHLAGKSERPRGGCSQSRPMPRDGAVKILTATVITRNTKPPRCEMPRAAQAATAKAKLITAALEASANGRQFFQRRHNQPEVRAGRRAHPPEWPGRGCSR